MILLRVLSYNGAPADGPAAQFDELGGTIGRADHNQLVLPDPERTISRVHARVVFRNGAYAVVDNGSNPISVNGVVIGAGREHPLRPGDELQIGGYVLGASDAAVAARSDPFADLFGDAPLGLAVASPPLPLAPATAVAAPPRTAPAQGAAAWPPPTPARSHATTPPIPPAAPAFAPGPIPEDWDPFAPDPAPAASTPPERQDPLAGLSSAAAESLDALFGLSGAPAVGDPLADPLGGGAAQALGARPNTAQPGDVLQSLARTATVMPPSRSDHVSELNTPMPLPVANAPVAPSPLPQGAVFSWNDQPTSGRVITLPAVRRVERPAPAAPPAAPAPPLALPPEADLALTGAAPPAAALPPLPPQVASSVPAVPPAGEGGDAAGPLLAALLQGLGTEGLRLQALTPATMQLLGQLLRESTRGAVELLVARAALKREMRAEMTMIVARENNPLKFSPNVEVALQHLLGPPAPGFMPPAAAMRDAFDDLRAHQLGVMAGMRAALDGVLQRFDPGQLEGKLSKRSAIDSLIPATRKARLWESFTELFAQLQTEAQDDFDELFGKAFVKAYEDQLDRLHGEPGPR